MCHSDASRPPAPAGAVPAAADGPLELRSCDGTRVLAHTAEPASPSGVGVLVLPDVRGLHEYYRQLAVRFAETGAQAVALDWFGRTAQDDDRAEGFDWQPHVQQTTPETIALDVAAGLDRLREQGATTLFTVGFCFGGSSSWRQSADTPGLAGVIGFYGRPSLVQDAVDRMRAPVLMLIAGDDAATPVEDSLALADAVRQQVEVRAEVFDGAPHSFFDRSFAEHAGDCTRAWRVIGEFIAEHA